jgi:hypothetical protein
MFDKAEMTVQEARVVQGVADGFTDPVIAERLLCSEQTVKFHLHNIYRKLDLAGPHGLGINKRIILARWHWDHLDQKRIDRQVDADSILERMESIDRILLDTDKRLELIAALLRGALQPNRHTEAKIQRALAEIEALKAGTESVSELAA